MKKIVKFLMLILVGISSAFTQQLISTHDKHGNKLFVDSNPRTGSAHRIYGDLPTIRTYGYEKKDISQTSVDDLSKKIFIDYESILKIDISQLKLKKAETDGNLWFITYKQAIDGVPIENAEIGYTVNQKGDIVALGADAFPKVVISTKPEVTESKAVEMAKIAFSSDSTTVERSSELVIFPLESKDSTILHLTWKVLLAKKNPNQEIYFFVDAHSGEIITQRKNGVDISFAGQITSSYWPVHTWDATVPTTLSTAHVLVYDIGNTCIDDVRSDVNGNYFTGDYQWGMYDLVFLLYNDWAAVYSNDQLVKQESGWRAPGSYVNCNWAATDGTSAIKLASIMHDYFKNTFSYSGMDHQTEIHVDMGPLVNGGARNGNYMEFGSEYGYSWARSSDVVCHEYAHNTIYSIYGGMIGDNHYVQSASMDEGLADYFSCSFNNDAAASEDCNVNRTLSNNYAYNPNNESHWNGQVIGGACWDLRQVVGQTICDNLVFRALQVAPHAYFFADFATNVIIADRNYYGGVHQSQILQAFANHQIYPPVLAASIPTATTEIYHPGTKGRTNTYIWTGSAAGGIPPYSYRWTRDGSTIGTSLSYTDVLAYAGGGDYYSQWTLGFTVTDANGQTANASKLITEYYSDLMAFSANYSLSQNSPNPFNPSTVISYSIAEPGMVNLTVYDMLGREVATLVNDYKMQGRYSVSFNASNLSSGIYIYRLRTAAYTEIKRMQLLK